MTAPEDIVRSFCSQWDGSMDRTRTAIRRHFTSATVWDNVGFACTTGPDEAIALWESFEKLGFLRIRVDMLSIAVVGNVVLTERVDHLVGPEGAVVISARLMGAFEIDGDKISHWRDYVDPMVLTALAQRAAK
jgi:limonene-1,2-epoxide hydrolase